jgi:conjugal transfer pilus assembly protein TraE
MNSILEVTDERARGEVKKDLMKIVAEQQGSQITQFFTPDMMQVDPAHLTSEVGGTVHTVVASKEVTSEHRIFRFNWSYNGVSLKLVGFGMVTKQDPST